MFKCFGNGNLVRDAEIKSGRNGEFMTFTIAHNNGKDKTGQERPATYISCIYSNMDIAVKIIPYLKKGKKISILGNATASVFKNKDDQYIAQLNVSVHEIELVSGRDKDDDTSFNYKMDKNDESITMDDIPF